MVRLATAFFPRATVCGLIMAAALLSSGCITPIDVWSEPGSSAQHLVIRFATSKRFPKPSVLWQMEVRSCDDKTVFWSILAENPQALPEPATSIVYGAAVDGLTVSHGPKPLTVPGCYVVEASAFSKRASHRGRVHFWVADDGEVKDLK